MANTNYQYPLDPFNGMQGNRGQHLGGQQQTAGVPGQYLGPWSTSPEQFRNQNAAVGAPQGAAAGHQTPQQHPMMAQGMGMMRNQDISAQMLHATSRMQPNGANPPNNFQQQQGQMSFPQNYANGMMNSVLPGANTAINPGAQQMGRPNLFAPAQVPLNPNLARQLQNLGTGVPNAPTMQRPSISGQTQAHPLQHWAQTVQSTEERIPQINRTVLEAIGTKNVAVMRQFRQALPEQKKRTEEDRNNMAQTTTMLAQSGNFPPDRVAQIYRFRDELANRMQSVCNHYEQLIAKLDDELQKLIQQQKDQQQQQQQQSHALSQAQAQARLQQQQPGRPPSAMHPTAGNNMIGIPYPTDGRGSSMGMHAQPPLQQGQVPQWNGQAATNPGQLATGNNGPLGPGPTAQFGTQPGFQHNPGVGTGANPGNAQQQQPTPRLNPAVPQASANPDPDVKNSFYRFLASQNIDQNPVYNGRAIDLWTLYHRSMAFDKHAPPGHPLKFRMIGAELGFPSENSQTDAMTAKVLQDWYFRIAQALNTMKRENPLNRPAEGPPPFGGGADGAHNLNILQRAKAQHPTTDFSSITDVMINNLPKERFLQRLQMLLTGNSNGPLVMPTGGMASTQPSILPNHRTQTPNNNEQVVAYLVSHAQDARDRQEYYKKVWATNFPMMVMNPVEQPENMDRWKNTLSQTLTAVRMLIPSLGAFDIMAQAAGEQPSGKEARDILAASMRAVKQMSVWQSQMPQVGGRAICLRQHELEQMLGFLQPLAERHKQRLLMITNPPAELHSMVRPTDVDLKTLGGFLTAMLPSQTPQPPPPQFSSQAPNRTPTPSSMPMQTPGPTHLAPTPPQMGANIRAQRRYAFSEAGAGPSSSPNHPTPSAVPTPAAPTPPAAASPPKQQKTTRNKPQPNPRRRTSKATPGTPTPVPEPASTPTPAAATTPASSTLKRSHDDAETPASHPEVQPNKRVKVEPAATPAPIPPPTPATPPSQLSAPIDRASIQNPEQALSILTDASKRAEVKDEGSAQGQSQEEFLQWLTQVLSGTPSSTSVTPAPQAPAEDPTSHSVPTTEAEAPGEFSFFDWGGYYSGHDTPAIPDLDKHETVSPESHNDMLTKTPPSQSNGTGKPGVVLDQGSSKTKAETSHAGSSPIPFADATYVSSPGFPYDGKVEPWEDPWAIA
ncbi:SubName: Full=Uncharacterized protein {ECO:0000313/EMBL:CCA71319.1} [Serendipita indica DSM 11827]|uniref:ARID domain-containing protein n=1 Tax=Serendipita indica (strain DSM 11827) TaxID=1109443 RepID=G4TJ19_SERID|nr:SubName: Full=Uncharacterized protein {ECO:0000313/EMBL:CCA71319.1} [Serendipita indica DSM 11827]CCA71319.1 hypothetical protein PIIN_05258 [Serendipita indica DSM 11827]